jgi:hypothetical protein
MPAIASFLLQNNDGNRKKDEIHVICGADPIRVKAVFLA